MFRDIAECLSFIENRPTENNIPLHTMYWILLCMCLIIAMLPASILLKFISDRYWPDWSDIDKENTSWASM